jgi:hypothetical protein
MDVRPLTSVAFQFKELVFHDLELSEARRARCASRP